MLPAELPARQPSVAPTVRRLSVGRSVCVCAHTPQVLGSTGPGHRTGQVCKGGFRALGYTSILEASVYAWDMQTCLPPGICSDALAGCIPGGSVPSIVAPVWCYLMWAHRTHVRAGVWWCVLPQGWRVTATSAAALLRMHYPFTWEWGEAAGGRETAQYQEP